MKDNQDDKSPVKDEAVDLGPPAMETQVPDESAKPHKKRNKKMIMAWVLVVLLALTAGAFAWLYYTKDESSSEQAEVTQPAEQNQSQSEDTEEPAPAMTAYTATVGKFSLKMDPEYVVVEKLDGGFEGGPATSVTIGTADSNTTGVVVTDPGQAFTIFARPEDGATLASNSRTDAMESNASAERQADGEFAGVTARIYVVDELFSTRHIIFVKNDIVYEITQLADNSAQNAIYQVVESGWSFVE